MARNIGVILLIICGIFGLYFLNLGFNVLPQVTQAVLPVEKWINIAGGILLIIGGFFAMKAFPSARRF